MNSDFFQQIEEAKKTIRSTNEDLSERDKLAKQGHSTTKMNLLLQQQMTKLSQQITALFAVLQEQQGNMNSITKPELERRKKMIFDIQSSCDNLRRKIDSSSGNKNLQLFSSSTAGSYKDNKDLNNLSIDVMKEDKKTFDMQYDKKLTALSDATHTIRIGQEAMGDELSYQNDILLPKLEDSVDKNNTWLNKTNKKLDRLLLKRSTSRLWLCLIVELVLLVVLIAGR